MIYLKFSEPIHEIIDVLLVGNSDTENGYYINIHKLYFNLIDKYHLSFNYL